MARNVKEEVLVFKSRLHTAVGTAFDAEALVCLEVVLTWIELGLTNVIVEGDSRPIINKCKTRSMDKSQISAHIKTFRRKTKDFGN